MKKTTLGFHIYIKYGKFWRIFLAISSSINLLFLRSAQNNYNYEKNVDLWICLSKEQTISTFFRHLFFFLQFFNIFFLGAGKTWNSSNWSKIVKHVQNVTKIINNFWRFKFETRSPYLQSCFVGKYCFHHQGISK